MENTQDKQQLAKDLYLQTDKTQTEIADILDVNRKTIYLWCKKWKWEETKVAIRQAPGALLQDLHNHITQINKKIADREDQCPTMYEVDMLRKLARMTKDLGKKNTGFYIEAFEELSYFIGSDDQVFKKKYAKHVSEFVHGTFGDHNFNITRQELQNLAEIRENLKKEKEKETQIEDAIEKEISAVLSAVALAKEETLAKEDASAMEEPLPQKPELIFDGYSFVPATEFSSGNYPFTNDAIEQALDCELPTEKHAPKETPMGKNGASAPLTTNPLKAATANISDRNASGVPCPNLPSKKIENNGTFVGAIPCGRPVEGNSPVDGKLLEPGTRPSPFREGNTIWINHPKDLDDYEKHLKMSDTIRYYPESDPSLIYNKTK